MSRAAALLATALALAGCAGKICTPAGGPAAVAPPPDWREAATGPDHAKLRGVRDAFVEGVDAARGAGFGARIDAAGRLFDPDYAEDGVTLPPGGYACTTTLLAGTPAFRAGAPARCTVTNEPDRLQRLVQLDGAQRPAGTVYPDIRSRTVFLGTLRLADEATPLHYGRDPDRDRIGAIQRIGPARWRVVMPHPAWGGTVAVMDLVPAK